MNAKELGAMPVGAIQGQYVLHPETGLPRDPYNGYGWMVEPQPGLTLRQIFAGLAMQGFIAHMTGPETRGNESGSQAHARAAVCYADALLSELSKDQP